MPISSLRRMNGWGSLSGLRVAVGAARRDGGPLGPGEERVGSDETYIANDMIEAIKATSLDRHPTGIVKRFNQAKSLACLSADFHVPDDLPENLRRGLFANPGHYSAKIRFANASTHDDRKKDFRGMSIHVYDVSGEPIRGEAGMQSFVLNSQPALFAGTPRKFLEFVRASREGKPWKFFIRPGNLDSLWNVIRGRQAISSPLDIRYWSTTPYRFGSDESIAVKYSVAPCSSTRTEKVASPGPDHLIEAVANHLRRGPACFDFMVQFQSDPRRMPIEDASVTWDESKASFQKVARITIEEQDFRSEQAIADCEMMTFNPWQALPEHRPLGGINRVRRTVYSEMGLFRNAENVSRGSTTDSQAQ